MSSNFVFQEIDTPQDSELGFFPAIPAIASAAGATGGAGKAGKVTGDLVDKVTSIVTGPKEKGSGLTKPGNVDHAIDKFDNANDYEAQRIAPKAIEMKRDGVPESQIAAYIARELGYPADGGVYRSDKWDYVSETLNQAVRQPAQQQSQQNGVPTPGGVKQAGISKIALYGGGILITGGLVAALVKNN